MRQFSPGPRPWIAGHRGALPEVENSIASFEQAVAEGASFVECDVQLVERALVLQHDRASARGQLPTLEDLFAALPRAAWVNVEVKVYDADPGDLVRALRDALLPRDGLGTLVSSFDRDLLLRLREADPALPLAPLAEELSSELVDLADRLGAWSIHLGTAPEASVLRALTRPVLIYTVNDVDRARELFEMGVAGLFSDRPGPLRAGIEALGRPGPAVV